jgi:hypothetical protein
METLFDITRVQPQSDCAPHGACLPLYVVAFGILSQIPCCEQRILREEQAPANPLYTIPRVLQFCGCPWTHIVHGQGLQRVVLFL